MHDIESFGGALFTRTSRRVELTEAGQLMLIEAKRTLAQAEHARQAVARALRGETGRVRVGFAGNAIFSGKMTTDLREFHHAYPDVELVIKEMAPQEQAEAILAGQLDVGYAPDNSSTGHYCTAYWALGVSGGSGRRSSISCSQ